MPFRWYRDAIKTTIDAAGRIVVPKPLRDALGLVPGTAVDISVYGQGLAVVPQSRAAHLVDEAGRPVAASDRRITDEEVFALIDAGRR